MSKFNSPTVNPTLTKNHAGGQAFQESPELELVSILLTSFVNDTYYRSSSDTLNRLKQVIERVDPRFAAQAAVYARNEFGMRSISHVAASELAKRVNGQPWAKSFYNAIIRRPDDMLEIASYHKANNGKLSNAMKDGFALAFEKFDGYQLAKYRGEGKGIKLIDLVNLVHPIPVEKNGEALKALVAGTLKNTQTWESKLSATKGDAEAKTEAWGELIRGKKLGYLALLRNLSNIMEQAPEVLDEALASLTNEGFIKKSLVFPFQYLIAYKQFSKTNSKEARKIAEALSTAIDLSCSNVRDLFNNGENEDSLVVIDNSGSMESSVNGSAHMHKSELGALFGIVLAKAINADIMEFGSYARYIPYNLSAHSMDFAAAFAGLNQVGHGTDFHAPFEVANKAYKRIFIFSDMQGWINNGEPSEVLKSYKRKFKADPFIYSIDLAGLGSLQFPEKNVFALAGFSEKIFDLVKTLETDKQALINTIKKVEF